MAFIKFQFVVLDHLAKIRMFLTVEQSNTSWIDAHFVICGFLADHNKDLEYSLTTSFYL